MLICASFHCLGCYTPLPWWTGSISVSPVKQGWETSWFVVVHIPRTCLIFLGPCRNSPLVIVTASSLVFTLFPTFYCEPCYFQPPVSPIQRYYPHGDLRQLPSNILLGYFGARNWLAFIVISWGIVQLTMGFVTRWGFLVFSRVLLGTFEVKNLAVSFTFHLS
jgi:hypothetical protein